jgi:HTH-type transcriptional regulator/antitoxin HigA
MTALKTTQQYDKAVERIEELLAVVGNDTPTTDKNFIELDLLSELVADYEAIHYPVATLAASAALKSSMRKKDIDANLILA